jgi:hypothetical protein
LNAYARSLPSLGFDPTPGDVDLTRDLAQHHSLVAQEARQVLAVIEPLKLNSLEGRAAEALRAIQGTFLPALRNTASAAETLQAAASSWADQLSGFQSEADLLDRQAAAATAHQQALHVQQSTMPPGSIVLADDLQSASATVAGIHQQAQELHQRYLAAADKTAAAVDEHSGLWAGTEPVRKVLELVLAPLDIVAADHWVSVLKEVAGVPSELVKGVGETVAGIEKLKSAGKPITQELIAAANFTESTGEKYDAWYAFAPGWLKTAAGSIAAIKGLSYTLSGLGLVSDVGTIISPQNQGALGVADRVAGISNGLLITGDLVLDGLPGIGEVALAATGAYLALDWTYQHWTPFRNVANDVGHATVRAADDIGHATVKAADDVGHTADGAWHKVTSFERTLASVGSLF